MFIGHFLRHLFKSLIYYSLLTWGNSLYILDRNPLAVCVLKKTQIFSRHVKIVTGSHSEALPSGPPPPAALCNAGERLPEGIPTTHSWLGEDLALAVLACYWIVTECHFFLMCRVLVGAPKADSKYSTSVKSPGAVFKCRVHTNPDRRCTELDMARGG